MTKIFTKVKPGDLITSDLFNQITDKIEKIDEITTVMEIKNNSEADASKLDNLTIKSNLSVGTKESPSELEVNGTVKTGNDGQLLLLKGIKSSKKGEESSMNLNFITSSQGRTPPPTPTASFRVIDDEYFSSHLGFFTKEPGEDQNNLTERLRITSNGKVGIGTNAPSEKLEVTGAIKADKFIGDGSGLTGIKTGQWTDVAGGISYNSGNVGIGTPSPENADGWTKVLDILGSVATKLSIRTTNIDARVFSHESSFWGAPAGMIVGTKTAHALSFGTSATSRMTINKDGNVGIGTSNPAAKLEVNLAGLGWNGLLNALRITSPDPTYYMELHTHVIGDSNVGYSFRTYKGITNKDALTIDTNGNIGIGTTGPKSKLTVAGSIEGGETTTGWVLGKGASGADNYLRLTTAQNGGKYHDFAIGRLWAGDKNQFDLAEVTPVKEEDQLEQGDVVVIDEENGLRVKRSTTPYDTSVYGIVSSYESAAMVIGGAGPEIVTKESEKLPIALIGRVKAKVSAEGGTIQVGDLLTTSSTPGHLMKCSEISKGTGAVAGKALEPFSSGKGTITVLVTLQ